MGFDVTLELLIAGKMMIALILGAIIGFDREMHAKSAGIRTYAVVCVGATLLTSVAGHIVDDPAAVSRIVANIITGVGFLGAGIMYLDGKGSVQGLTTAATVWCTAAVGIAVGLNMFIIAIAATSIIYGLICLHHQRWYLDWKQKRANRNSIHLDQ